MNTNLVLLIVVTHILGSLFWAGAMVIQASKKDQILEPKKSGRYSGPQWRKDRFPMYISIVFWVVMFSGIVLYWRVYGGIPKTNYGLVMGLLVGLVAMILLLKVNSSAVKRLALVAGQTRQTGNFSTSQQLSEIKTLEERISYSGVAVILLLFATVVVIALG